MRFAARVALRARPGLAQFFAALLRPFCRLPGGPVLGNRYALFGAGRRGQNIRELAMRRIVGPAGCNRERRNLVMKD